MRRTTLVVMGAVLSLATSGLAVPSALAATHPAVHAAGAAPTIYDSTVQPNPGNLPSQSYEASAMAEFGNQVTFGGTARVLDTVVVQMSSWGCQSGNWSTYNTAPCVTAPGATFPEAITLNIYNVGPATSHGPSSAGSIVASETHTFNVPYRPSADTNYATDCAAEAAAKSEPVSNFAGTWYDAQLNKCFNGYITPIEFTFGHVVLPNSVVYGIAYNTSDFGYSPQGDATACHSSAGGCGYDSLNVALSQEPTAPSVGSDAYPGTVYENVDNASYQSNYCDGGAAGINAFRIDEPANWPVSDGTTSGCWSAGTPGTSPWYIPAVQFNAVSTVSPTITSASSAAVVAGTPFSFTVTTTGVPIPGLTITSRRSLPAGLSFQDNHDGTATISGNALTHDRNKTYIVIVRARNGNNSLARQRLMLVLTGGR